MWRGPLCIMWPVVQARYPQPVLRLHPDLVYKLLTSWPTESEPGPLP